MSSVRASVKPELLLWARERAGLGRRELAKKSSLKRLLEWEEGVNSPTLRQLEIFAKAVHIPIGYLFLSKPPQEELPISDFRVVAGGQIRRPTPNLLDTLYACQERQEWYREYARQNRYRELGFVGQATVNSSIIEVSREMRRRIRFVPHQQPKGVDRARREFVKATEAAGIMVMVNSMVLNNRTRRLDPKEFRGFALYDPLAPLIFVNGADAKVAQIFTLAHEIAHLWLGKSAISNFGDWQNREGARQEEVWCNRVAAEYLVPQEVLEDRYNRVDRHGSEPLMEILPQLHRTFKVSEKALLIRLLDSGLIYRDDFDQTWRQIDKKPEDVQPKQNKKDGRKIDTHVVIRSRVGRRFSEALIASTLEGSTLYRDACHMLGLASSESFARYAKKFY